MVLAYTEEGQTDLIGQHQARSAETMAFDALIESQSILSNTLILFAATAAAVAVMFVAIIWWVVRGGGNAPAPA